ncbi:MAG: PIN domain nuclease [Vicinamibacterales bacterium]|jgi:hypothetical protein
MVIVDTTVWIDYFNGTDNAETNWLELRLDQDRLGLTTIILSEILQGIRDEKTAVLVEADLLQFAIFEASSRTLAVQAARNYRTLRRRGKTVRKTIDVLIATFCIEEQHSLLHRDRDFDAFEELLGLSVVHA